jgi:hypothetical protein
MILAMLLIFSACQREARQLVGEYSYKLSGDLIIMSSNGSESHHYLHRIGQMNVLRDKSSKTGFVVTMNEMNGGCYTFPAELSGDTLVLPPHTFTTTFLSSDGLDITIFNPDDNPTMVYTVRATGGGRINGDVLILKESWNGQQVGNPIVTFRAPEMTILAEKN